MGRWVVSCESCDVSWPRLGAFSEYERAAIESRPCPCCGAYTLTCPGPEPVRHGRVRVRADDADDWAGRNAA